MHLAQTLLCPRTKTMKLNRTATKKAPSDKGPADKAHPGLHGWLSSLWNGIVTVLYAFTHDLRVTHHATMPREGAVLVLAKHSTYSDVPLGKLAITRNAGRHLWCVMKDSMARGPLAGLFLRVGGIPINRDNPERSKRDLLLARKVLHDGHVLCIFPEQTIYLNRMGRGRAPGFRFITGRPPEPIAVVCVGFRYTKRRFRRVLVEIQIGAPTYYTREHDPEVFLDERMREMAGLSGLEYPYERPVPRRARPSELSAEPGS